jgi:hypothetical protein
MFREAILSFSSPESLFRFSGRFPCKTRANWLKTGKDFSETLRGSKRSLE